MIKAVFYKAENGFSGFSLTGHAMFELDGPDVVCAAVSAMTNLVLNTLTEVFSCDLATVVDGDEAKIEATVENVTLGTENSVNGVIKGFMLQLKDLQEQYPENLQVAVEQQNITKGR
ncbi:MAG: ribosomal-processing cysteine protease Prp [Clostridia bacterium]|nr:ribosomal-processing cysteine protease Prp [Clostridia bacterium]